MKKLIHEGVEYLYEVIPGYHNRYNSVFTYTNIYSVTETETTTCGFWFLKKKITKPKLLFSIYNCDIESTSYTRNEMRGKVIPKFLEYKRQKQRELEIQRGQIL
jgi:hypothetical protein